MTTTAPDIQYFGSNGLWVKPEHAVRVDVILRGGDGGSTAPPSEAASGGLGAMTTSAHLGYELSPNGYIAASGNPGEIRTSSHDARQLPEVVEVEVGKGGRPDGRDGYALIVTHLESVSHSQVIETGGIWFQGGICATCGNPVPGGGHQDGCTGLVPGSEYRIDSRVSGRQENEA